MLRPPPSPSKNLLSNEDKIHADDDDDDDRRGTRKSVDRIYEERILSRKGKRCHGRGKIAKRTSSRSPGSDLPMKGQAGKQAKTEKNSIRCGGDPQEPQKHRPNHPRP